MQQGLCSGRPSKSSFLVAKAQSEEQYPILFSHTPSIQPQARLFL
jgi:hypothetical protein